MCAAIGEEGNFRALKICLSIPINTLYNKLTSQLIGSVFPTSFLYVVHSSILLSFFANKNQLSHYSTDTRSQMQDCVLSYAQYIPTFIVMFALKQIDRYLQASFPNHCMGRARCSFSFCVDQNYRHAVNIVIQIFNVGCYRHIGPIQSGATFQISNT